MDADSLQARVDRVARGDLSEVLFTAEELASVPTAERVRFSRAMDRRIKAGEFTLEVGPEGRVFRLTRT